MCKLGALTTNHNFLMQGCMKLKLGSFCLPWILHLPRYSYNLPCTSVFDKEGIFTEQNLSVNSFITTSNNGCNLKTNLRYKNETKIFKLLMDRRTWWHPKFVDWSIYSLKTEVICLCVKLLTWTCIFYQ